MEPASSIFRSEYEQELEAWLRQRLRWLWVMSFVLITAAAVVRSAFIVNSADAGKWWALVVHLVGVGAILWLLADAYAKNRGQDARRDEMLRGVTRIILLLGSIALCRDVVVSALMPSQRTDFLFPIFFWHFTACLLLPWSPIESLRAFVPLLVAWALAVLLLGESDLTGRVLTVIFGPGVLIPGLGASALRLHLHGESFRSRMVGKHFVTMREELARARSIHESLFPAAYDDGFLRFDYSYTPMRDLGGDYVHVHIAPDGVMHAVLIDVTGHGLAAALTVNRLSGELERIRGEMPDAEPSDVIELLNRYIHLTLARHQIFATALALRVDPIKGELTWCSAGHPPAYLRGVNGTVTLIESTTVLMGAISGPEFVPVQRQLALTPGDTIVMMTDGAFEARNRAGEQLGLPALRAMLDHQPAPEHWPRYIATQVKRHLGGKGEDDILVAAIALLKLRPRSQRTPEAAFAGAQSSS